MRVSGDVFAGAVYEGAVRAGVLAYKERGRRDLARALAILLGAAVDAAVLSCSGDGGNTAGRQVVLVCVPSIRAVASARGGDHVLRLARRAGPARGLRVARDVLCLQRDVRDSAGLNSRERVDNLAGAISARPAVGGLAALLIDDIVTTGSTLSEARRALAAAGWPVAGAAVVAATPRRFGPAVLPLAAPRITV